MKTICRWFFGLWLGMLLAAASAAGQAAGELRHEARSADSLSVTDWAQGFVDVTGSATARFTGNRVQEELLAKSAARLVAHARLVEVLKGIRVTGKTTVANMVVADQKIDARFEGFVKGAVTLAENVEWRTDPAADRGEVPFASVTLRLCMTRSHAACRDSSLIETLPGAKAVSRAPDPPRPPEPSVRYTGLIVDLENVLFLPVLLPEIVTRSGTVLYSRGHVEPAVLRQSGVVRYARTVGQAIRLPLVGGAPLIVKAVEVTDDNRIVVSETDAAIIQLASRRTDDFLSGGRVVIALD